MKIERRSFVKLCASAVAAASANPTALASQDRVAREYQRVKLVNGSHRPFAASDLAVGETYLFHYPYICTPCFLINLGKPVEGGSQLETKEKLQYQWKGGVGPLRSLVAFSAICAHKMSHPARQASFINYRHEPVNFLDRDVKMTERGQVISCCSERSVYDPTDGARVIGGPAPQPLAAIILEHDESDDSLSATGTYGGEMFERFFEKFSFRLQLEYATDNVESLVKNESTVTLAAEFTGNQILC